MTAPVQFPDPTDKEAVRRWMRESRRTEQGQAVPATPEAFADMQRRRFLRAVSPEGEGAARPQLHVALTGAATDQHTVRASMLGSFLENLQESVSAVAQALMGRPTLAASIPRSIREATALNVAAFYPSSFGVAIYGPAPDAVRAEGLFPSLPGDPAAVLDETLDAVFDVVDLSENKGLADELLTERLVPLGPRAVKHLGALTAGLSDAQLGLRLSWESPGGRTRDSVWTPDGAQRVRYLCEHSEFQEAETIQVTGWLGSASALRGQVEIITNSGEIIRARTAADLTPHLHEYFGNRVEATVEVTKVRAAGGRERAIYAVLGLTNLSG